MADVRLHDVQKFFGNTQVLFDVNLHIQDGEFIVFVGPSGCGKSTLLRVIAGLEDISAGDIFIGGAKVNEVSPSDRGIAMVFQSYALYPHMSLYDNMAFGLKLARMPKPQIQEAIKNAAQILHIEHLLDRKPKALSGGQRQRVAIGRAIVRKPQVFLFDEPLSNLDAALRVKMRYEFAKLHDELKTTMVYVTHDQVEAMTLADRIVVLSAGRIEQVGAPLELYQYPVNQFVAGFIGSPKMNFLNALIVQASAGSATVRLDSGHTLEVDVDASSAQVGDKVTLGVRPESVQVGGTANRIEGIVTFYEPLGHTTHAYVAINGVEEPLTCELAGESALAPGDPLAFSVPAQLAHLFNAQGQAFQRHYQMPQRKAA